MKLNPTTSRAHIITLLFYILLVTLTQLTPSIHAQARAGLLTKLRRRQSQLYSRTRKPPRAGNNELRETANGIVYVSDRELMYRSEFHREHYLPGLAYWRMDNDMPGVTRPDRFRGAYSGYQSDYYQGRF